MSIKILASYRQLLKTFRERVPEGEEDLVRRAFQFAYRAHRDQKRLSGEPYIIHPIAVSQTLAELGLDSATVAAGLLHDVVEDTQFGEDFIKREFGEEIQNLVKAVTKISLVKKDSVQPPPEGSLRTLKEKEAAENIRLMLLATARDVRVILIKLADKLHNMRTLQFQKPEKVERIARETLNIYAPIAGRLGMFGIKSELEDLAFASLDRSTYKEIVVGLKQSRSEREEFIKKLRKILQQRLADINITARVEGRAKHIYSIYQKMNRDNRDLTRVYDLRGVRIIVDEVRDCYGALGIVHTLWPPVPGRFKDYIAMPKINGYQSLHTTVVGPDGRPLEVQIRTRDMDERAVFGIAAHWLYKTGSTKEERRNEKLKWLAHLSRLTQEFHGDTSEFIEDLRHELNPHEVFVFTPKGEILNLPVGATVLDFAFRIHTDIGLRCRGAIVNDRMVPLRTELKSGDRVEILTNPQPNPSPVWLRYVNSPRARQKLRGYFRKQEEEEPDLPEEPSSTEKVQERPIKIRRRKSSDPKKVPIEVAGATDIPVRYAGCCSPVPGDRIIGFVTRGRGVTVHRADCPHIPSEDSEKDRLISVRWEGLTETYPVQIEIDAEDRQGLYLDLVGAIARTQTNILKAQADIPRNHRGTMKATFLLEVEHVDQLNDIRETLQAIPGVYEVRRVLGPGVGPEKVAGGNGKAAELAVESQDSDSATLPSLIGGKNGKPRNKKKQKA
ncbi:MAG: GTP pyrophosphokinase [Spirochaetaceae bacterium]|nr:GTP pyrophosphokinase [Spirochaetaceae bacterium]